MAISGNAWRYLKAFTCRYSFTCSWICLMSFIFWASYSKYKMEPKYFYLRQILGSGLCLSRGMASVLNICCFLVVLPTCRLLTTWIRYFSNQLSNNFVRKCIDSSKGLHIACAYTIVIASAFHSVAHIVNAQNFSRHYNSRFKHINMAQYKGQDPLVMVIGTVPGITGILMMVILCILCASSVKYIRVTCYNMFWIFHHLFFLFLILLLCHPISGLLKEQSNILYHIPGCEHINASYGTEVGYAENTYGSSGTCTIEPIFIPQTTQKTCIMMITSVFSMILISFTVVWPNISLKLQTCTLTYHYLSEVNTTMSNTWKWVTAALSVYVVDLGWRLLRRRTPIHVVSFQAYKCQMLCLKFIKDGFKAKPGQYVFLQCTAVSSLEWHPFSISKCPTNEDPTFTIHLRTVGDWSCCVKKYLYLQTIHQNGLPDVPLDDFAFKLPSHSNLNNQFLIDGPFSSCLEDMHRHSICICIAGGIGITPFASLLNCLRADPKRLDKLKRLHLIWICRDAEMFHEFCSMMLLLFNLLWESNKPDVIDIQLYLTQNHSLEKLKAIFKENYAFIYTRIDYGRPRWSLLFHQWRQVYKKKNVGLFCCGPKSLNKEMKKFSKLKNLQGCNFSYYHESFS